MSYRCQNCNKQVPAGRKLIRTVTEVRPKEYPRGVRGVEIVTERAVCATCLVTLREEGSLARLDDENLS